jgi:hypothetical protein
VGQRGLDPDRGRHVSQIIDFREETGFAPNILVIGPHVLQALRNHPEILDRIKYTERGIVTEDLIASLLGVEKILVSYATQANGATFQDPADRGERDLLLHRQRQERSARLQPRRVRR